MIFYNLYYLPFRGRNIGKTTALEEPFTRIRKRFAVDTLKVGITEVVFVGLCYQSFGGRNIETTALEDPSLVAFVVLCGRYIEVPLRYKYFSTVCTTCSLTVEKLKQRPH